MRKATFCASAAHLGNMVRTPVRQNATGVAQGDFNAIITKSIVAAVMQAHIRRNMLQHYASVAQLASSRGRQKLRAAHCANLACTPRRPTEDYHAIDVLEAR